MNNQPNKETIINEIKEEMNELKQEVQETIQELKE